MTIRQLTGAVAIIFIGFFVAEAPAAEPSLKEIMQDLRNNLVAITDGLLLDDLERVAQGATGIAQHAPIAEAQVKRIADALGPEMPAFKQFDNEVHTLSVAIASAAGKNERASIISEYQRMVSACLACHTAFKARVAETLGQDP